MPRLYRPAAERVHEIVNTAVRTRRFIAVDVISVTGEVGGLFVDPATCEGENAPRTRKMRPERRRPRAFD